MQTPGPAAVEAARAFGDFLRVETMDFFLFPWSPTSSSGGGAGTATAPQGVQDLPALGLNREHQLRWQRHADTGRRMGDAQHRLQLLWSDALRDAAIAFAARAEPPPYLRTAMGSLPGAQTLPGLSHSWTHSPED